MTDDAKKTILLRRAKFVAAALGTVGLVACGGKSESVPPTTTGDAAVTDARSDTSPEPCLGVALDSGGDTAPMPCLSAPLDSGADTAPTPCLDVAPDGGPDTFEAEDAGPAPCLKMPPPDGG